MESHPLPRHPKWLWLACTLVSLLACASPAPTGPLFEPLPAPGPGESLLYLYRQDENAARGELRMRLDGTELETLQDGEFAALLIAPGDHLLEVSLRRIRFLPTAWTQVAFCVDESATAFVRLWTRLVAEETGESRQRDVAAPGWSSQRAKLALLVASESSHNALPRLETQRKAEWSPRALRHAASPETSPFGSRCRQGTGR